MGGKVHYEVATRHSSVRWHQGSNHGNKATVNNRNLFTELLQDEQDSISKVSLAKASFAAEISGQANDLSTPRDYTDFGRQNHLRKSCNFKQVPSLEMSDLRKEDSSAQPCEDRGDLQPTPEAARDTDSPALTSSKAQDDAKLSLETNRMDTKDGPDNTDSTKSKILTPKSSELEKQITTSAGYVRDQSKCVMSELHADSSRLSWEQQVQQRATVSFPEVEMKEGEGQAATDPDVCRFSQGLWGSMRESSEKKPKPIRLFDAIAQKVKGKSASAEDCLGPFFEAQRISVGIIETTDKKTEQPAEDIAQNPPLCRHRKRKHSGNGMQKDGSESDNLVNKLQDEFISKAKQKRSSQCLPVVPESSRMKSLSSTKANNKRQAQTSSAPALSLAAKQQKIKKSPKTDKKEDFQPESLPQKHAQCEKPPGKRMCKTKHLQSQRRRRSFPAWDSTSDTENDEDKLVVPKKVRKQVEPTSDGDPLPFKICEKLDKARQQPPESTTPEAASPPPQLPPSQPIPYEPLWLNFDRNTHDNLLQRATRLGYEKVVRYCLENKVCGVNSRDNAGYSALHKACARGWLSIARYLLDQGADVNCSAYDGTRPIHEAVANDYLETTRLLLFYGADPRPATNSGRTIKNMINSKQMDTFLRDYFK